MFEESTGSAKLAAAGERWVSPGTAAEVGSSGPDEPRQGHIRLAFGEQLVRWNEFVVPKFTWKWVKTYYYQFEWDEPP